MHNTPNVDSFHENVAVVLATLSLKNLGFWNN